MVIWKVREKAWEISGDDVLSVSGYDATQPFAKYFCLFSFAHSSSMPTRPSVLTIKGHAATECGKLLHNLDLGSLGQQYGVTLSPKLWGDDLASFVAVRAALQLDAGKTTIRTFTCLVMVLMLRWLLHRGNEIESKCIVYNISRQGWLRYAALPSALLQWF